MAGACTPAAAAPRSLSVGPGGRTVLRLQLRDGAPAALSVRHDVLSDVGRHVISRASSTRRREPAAVRSAGRHPDEYANEREPVGCALRLGAAAADCG